MGVPAVVVAAFVGTTFESVVGAALEKRQLLDNEALNFLNTLVGALVAAAFALPGSPERSSSMNRKALALLAARAPVHAAAAAAGHRLGRDLRLRLGAQPGPLPHRVSLTVVLTVALGSLCASFMNAASNAINQIYDLEIDRLNKPNRPLVTGALRCARPGSSPGSSTPWR